VPARFREELGPRFIITKGLESCLFVFTLGEWQRLQEELRELPFTKADVRAFLRFLFASATEVEPDRQGRVLVTPHLRQYARLEREAVVIGVSNRVELWDPSEWDRYLANVAGSPEALAEKLGELGIFG
jgi:MraZ protein